MNKVSQNRWKTPTRLRNNWQLLSVWRCVALRVSHTRTYIQIFCEMAGVYDVMLLRRAPPRHYTLPRPPRGRLSILLLRAQDARHTAAPPPSVFWAPRIWRAFESPQKSSVDEIRSHRPLCWNFSSKDIILYQFWLRFKFTFFLLVNLKIVHTLV